MVHVKRDKFLEILLFTKKASDFSEAFLVLFGKQLK